MALVTYVNGTFVPKEEAKVSVYDHGYLYGDGIFEGIRAYDGRIFRLEQHLDRLFESARYLMLEIPLSRDELRAAILETVRRCGLRDAYIRPVISRGVGDLGLDPRKCRRATVVIIVDTIQLYPKEAYERGLRAITATTRKVRPDALSPQAKTLNYLNNIMARLEANQAGVEEAIMLTADGYVSASEPHERVEEVMPVLRPRGHPAGPENADLVGIAGPCFRRYPAGQWYDAATARNAPSRQ